MTNLADYRPLIREALWLFWLLNTYAETPASDKPWLVVTGGRGVADTELGARLGVSEDTARRWRVRLESAELLRCSVVGPRLRRIEIINHMLQTPETEPGNTSGSRGLVY